MPPKRTQAKKRTLIAADGGPPAQRSRRQSTRNATLVSQATASVVAETEPRVVPPLDILHTTSQRLAPELVQSLVSTVAAEFARQLTATLPALASQLRPQPPLATRNASELAEEPTSTHDVSATTLVEGAISAAHSRITALQNPTFVDTKLEQELAAERTAGPFTSPPFPSFCISPLGLIPKKTPGDFRLIHHLSFPKGLSINDGILSEDTHVRYATVTEQWLTSLSLLNY